VTTPRRYSDVEAGLLIWLKDFGYCTTWTPPGLPQLLAELDQQGEQGTVLRIHRIGGPADTPTISVQNFNLRDSGNPRAGVLRALDIEAHMSAIGDNALPLDLPSEWGGGKVRLDSAEMTSGPVELPWPDPAVSLVECIYTVSTRR